MFAKVADRGVLVPGMAAVALASGALVVVGLSVPWSETYSPAIMFSEPVVYSEPFETNQMPPETVKPLVIAGSLAIDPACITDVPARVAGRIVSAGSTTALAGPALEFHRSLQPGDRVSKGQLLATVWNPELGEKKSRLLASVSRLLFDEAGLERMRKGNRDKEAISDLESESQGERVKLARAERDLQAIGLSADEIAAIRAAASELHQGDPDYSRSESWSELEVRAPQDGVVVHVQAGPGNEVEADTVVFQIADIKHLLLHAQAARHYMTKLAELDFSAQQWAIRCAADPSQSVFKTPLSLIHMDGDAHPSATHVTIRIDNRQGIWRPGQNLTATLLEVEGNSESAVCAANISENTDCPWLAVEDLQQPAPNAPTFSE